MPVSLSVSSRISSPEPDHEGESSSQTQLARESVGTKRCWKAALPQAGRAAAWGWPDPAGEGVEMLGFGRSLREGSVWVTSRLPGQSMSAGGRDGPCSWVMVMVATGEETRAGGLEPDFRQRLSGDWSVSPWALLRRCELDRRSCCQRRPQPVLCRHVLFRLKSA